MGVIIYGPMATGKTMLASQFAHQFGCLRVIEGDEPSRRGAVRKGDLVLTNADLATVRKRYPDQQIVHINEARIAIGRDPAPKGGFLPNTPSSPEPAAACACRCHTGTCGENAMVLAERTIRLIEKLRPIDHRMISEIERIVDSAGVDFAREAIGAPDDGVPF